MGRFWLYDIEYGKLAKQLDLIFLLVSPKPALESMNLCPSHSIPAVFHFFLFCSLLFCSSPLWDQASSSIFLCWVNIFPLDLNQYLEQKKYSNLFIFIYIIMMVYTLIYASVWQQNNQKTAQATYTLLIISGVVFFLLLVALFVLYYYFKKKFLTQIHIGSSSHNLAEARPLNSLSNNTGNNQPHPQQYNNQISIMNSPNQLGHIPPNVSNSPDNSYLYTKKQSYHYERRK